MLGAGMALWLALAGMAAHAAEHGIYTLADGDARVLRAITWYRLAPGARIEPGDVVDVAEHAAVQLELAQGGTLNVQGPARIVARNAAQRARDGDEFMALVAEHIGMQERDAFLREFAER
jgi:hypothetical protein